MIKPIKSKRDHESALERIYELMQMNLTKGSSKSDELEVLSILVKHYEDVHFPIPKADPVSAIRFRMEQMGLSESELTELLGYRSRKSEILSGKRKLSLIMIRKLHEILHIPADILIQAS